MEKKWRNNGKYEWEKQPYKWKFPEVMLCQTYRHWVWNVCGTEGPKVVKLKHIGKPEKKETKEL